MIVRLSSAKFVPSTVGGMFELCVPPFPANVTLVTPVMFSTSNVGPVVLTANVTLHVVVPLVPVTVTCNPSRHRPVKSPLTTSNEVDDDRLPTKQPLLQAVNTTWGGLTTPFANPKFVGQPDCEGASAQETGRDT